MVEPITIDPIYLVLIGWLAVTAVFVTAYLSSKTFKQSKLATGLLGILTGGLFWFVIDRLISRSTPKRPMHTPDEHTHAHTPTPDTSISDAIEKIDKEEKSALDEPDDDLDAFLNHWADTGETNWPDKGS